MEPRLFFIGDSFVNGTGDPAALGWVGRVCASLQAEGAQLTFYNLGIRGDTTAMIAQRWQSEVQSRLAPGSQAGFVFSFGANDVDFRAGQQRVTQADSLENAQAIFKTAQSLGSVLMVGSPPIADDPDTNRRLAELSSAIQSLCQSRDIPFVPTLDTLVANSAWMTEAIANDGAHPGTAGYQALAALLLRSPVWKTWIASLLGQNRDKPTVTAE